MEIDLPGSIPCCRALQTGFRTRSCAFERSTAQWSRPCDFIATANVNRK